MKFFAIITTALVVASVSAGTLRSEYKYKEHAEAIAAATKERVEGWEANNRAVQEATEKRVEGWRKNRQEINKATAEKFDRLAEQRSKEQDKKQEARRRREQGRAKTCTHKGTLTHTIQFQKNCNSFNIGRVDRWNLRLGQRSTLSTNAYAKSSRESPCSKLTASNQSLSHAKICTAVQYW